MSALRPSAPSSAARPTHLWSASILAGVVAVGLLAACLPTAHAQTNRVPPQFLNLVSVQRTNSFFVDTTYDLIDPDSTVVLITAEWTTNGGTTWTAASAAASGGDVGWLVPGTGKRFVWNAWNDVPGILVTNAKIRLTANDPMPAIPAPPATPPSPNLVWIPSGSFVMQDNYSGMGGSPTYVYLSRPYWMGKYEVAQGEFMALMTNNPSAHTGNTNLPVDSVTWEEATNYCARLTAQEQTAGRISTNQTYRLPTEAEWEFAYRAGTTNTYYYGDDCTLLPGFAWYNANCTETQVGGRRIPNGWGLYDMSGNVVEWCQDGRWSLPGGGVTDPKGGSDTVHMIRGGSWRDGYFPCFPNYRTYTGSYNRCNYVGFRVVLAPAQ